MRIVGECASLNKIVIEGLDCSFTEESIARLLNESPGLPVYLNNDFQRQVGTIISVRLKGDRVIAEADVQGDGILQPCWLLPSGVGYIYPTKVEISKFTSFGLCVGQPKDTSLRQVELVEPLKEVANG
jgi:hypothetical protein